MEPQLSDDEPEIWTILKTPPAVMSQDSNSMRYRGRWANKVHRNCAEDRVGDFYSDEKGSMRVFTGTGWNELR